MVNFVFNIIERFRYLLRLIHYKRNRSKSAFFEGGGSLSAQISEGRSVGVRKLE